MTLKKRLPHLNRRDWENESFVITSHHVGPALSFDSLCAFSMLQAYWQFLHTVV